jgi:hypothetical protein
VLSVASVIEGELAFGFRSTSPSLSSRASTKAGSPDRSPLDNAAFAQQLGLV